MQTDLREVLSLVVINIQTFGIFIELLYVSTNQHKVSCAEPLCSTEVRGENTPERKVASTGDRIHNHLVMSPTRSPLSHPGGASTSRRRSSSSRSKSSISSSSSRSTRGRSWSTSSRSKSSISSSISSSSSRSMRGRSWSTSIRGITSTSSPTSTSI